MPADWTCYTTMPGSDLKWFEVIWSNLKWLEVTWSLEVIWIDETWSVLIEVIWSILKWLEAIWSYLKWIGVIWSDLKLFEVTWNDLKWLEVNIYFHLLTRPKPIRVKAKNEPCRSKAPRGATNHIINHARHQWGPHHISWAAPIAQASIDRRQGGLEKIKLA